jgi:hypothetical protein
MALTSSARPTDDHGEGHAKGGVMPMEPIFDSAGRPVAWLYRQQFLIDRFGVCRAFIRGRVLFSMDRRVLGEFSQGYVWDTQGEAVAFVRGASNGPVLPAPHYAGSAPIPPVVSVPVLPPVVASQPVHRIKWSLLSMDTFLALRATPQRPDRRRSPKRLGASHRAPVRPVGQATINSAG